MSLTPVYYQVTIDGTSYASTGFVDNTTVEMYAESNGGIYPVNLANSELKTAANMRWLEIVQQLSFTATPISIDNFVKTGSPNQDNAPTTFQFTIGYDRADYVYADNLENIPVNTPYLYGPDAITRQVARALIASIKNENQVVYNPTIITGQGGNNNGPNPQGPMILPVNSPSMVSDILTAQSLVTVTQVVI